MTPDKGQLEDLRIDRTGRVAKPSRGRYGWWIIGLAVLAIGGGLWAKQSRTPEVRTEIVRAGSAQDPGAVLNASGYVTARRRATVSSKVTGKVVEVLLEEGMKVEEGQVLARLDASNVETSLKLAEAQARSAKAALAETQARLEVAELDLKRITDLAKTQVSSQSDLDNARANAEALKAHLDQQEADVIVADRQVKVWQQQMDDMIIRAPFAGIVVTKDAQPGEMISPVSAGGGFTRTGIGTVVDMTSLEIEVDVNENYLNRVQAGQAVVATLDSYPDWKIPAKVIAIIPTADRQKATVKVRIGFEALDPRILPDMGVKVAFQGTHSRGDTAAALTVPKSAVRQVEGRDTVLVVKDGRVQCRAVTLGAAQSDTVAVVSGLSPGDKVVVRGPQSLAEGVRVREAKL